MTAQSSPRSGMARLLTEMLPCSDSTLRPVLEFVVDAVLRAVQDGHTGLALQDISDQAAGLHDWPAARVAASLREVLADGDAPLVRRGDLIQLARWAQREATLGAALMRRAAVEAPPIDDAWLDACISRLFTWEGRPPSGDASEPSWGQQVAVRRLLGRRIGVLAGGPGTGKTTTVVRLLAARMELATLQGSALPRVLLLAPTGKAAARLAQSVAAQVEGLQTEAVGKAAIPRVASTIHRALGPLDRTLQRFRYHAQRKLPVDVVLVDEVSMVDLDLMSHLMAALPAAAELVLIGDPDQLPSVGCGDLLRDVMMADTLEDVRAVLTYSHRFASGGQIGAVARSLLAGESGSLIEALGERFEDCVTIQQVRLRVCAAAREVFREDVDAPGMMTADARAARLLERNTSLGILSATRVGPTGVEALNGVIENDLMREGLAHGTSRRWPGCPIIVRDNAPECGVFNGDVGVLSEDEEGVLHAWFEDGSGGVRSVSLVRLPRYDLGLCLTVHQSQGSEMTRVLMVLPLRPNRGVYRALLYTGVTRARSTIDIVGGRAALREGVSRTVRRTGGLQRVMENLPAAG